MAASAECPPASPALGRTLLRVKRRRSEVGDVTEYLRVEAETGSAVAVGGGDGDAEGGAAKRGRFERVTFALAGTVEASASSEDIGQVLRAPAVKQAPAAASAKEVSAAEDTIAQRVKAKARRASRSAAKEARYKVLGRHRQMELDQGGSGDGPDKADAFKVFDVELTPTHKRKPRLVRGEASGLACNDVELVREVAEEDADDDYVFDLYYLSGGRRESADESSTDIGDYIDRLVNVRAYGEDDHWFGEYRGGDDGDDEGESDDSNAEDYYANDYPEEEEDDEEDDEDCDVVRGMGRMGLEDESDGFGFDSDSSVGDGDDRDNSRLIESMSYSQDEAKHGAAYARFKRRVLRGEDKDSSDDEDDDVSDDSEVDIDNIDEYY